MSHSRLLSPVAFSRAADHRRDIAEAANAGLRPHWLMIDETLDEIPDAVPGKVILFIDPNDLALKMRRSSGLIQTIATLDITISVDTAAVTLVPNDPTIT